MHYYQHHIGDFIKDTYRLPDSHLAAYLRMMWMYYESEQPLPDNAKVIGLKIGADQEVVMLILESFFMRDGDSWRHKRCDQEIAEYHGICERNNANGKKGGRPKKAQTKPKQNPVGFQVDAICTKSETQSEPTGNPNETLTSNHKPVTNNQEPITSIGKPTFVAEDGRGLNTHNPAVCVESPQQPTTAGAVCLAMKAEGVTDVNPSHPKLTALLAAGATVDEVVCAARAASKRGKGFAYTLGTLERQRADAASMASNLHRGPMPNRADALRAKNHAVMSDWMATQEPQNAAI